MRISTSHVFSQNLKQVNSALGDVSELTTMTATQKRINKPSDDPSGMGVTVNLRSYNAKLEGFEKAAEKAEDLLAVADQALMLATDTITSALEQSEQAATGTYTAEQREMIGDYMRTYMQNLMTAANTKLGDDYIFAGNDVDNAPYTMALGATIPESSDIPDASIAEITGEADHTISVEFLESGTVGADALEYRYTSDGGSTWTTATLASNAAPAVLDLGDAQVELAAATAVTPADDEGGSRFHVRPAVVYSGSDNAQSVAISESSTVDLNTVGSDVFGGLDKDGAAYADPNLFEILGDLTAYMEMNDIDGIAASLAELRNAQEALTGANAEVGGREEQVSYALTSLEIAQERTANAISTEEDADAAQLSIELSQAQYVYQAVLQTASDTMGLSLLNYI